MGGWPRLPGTQGRTCRPLHSRHVRRKRPSTTTRDPCGSPPQAGSATTGSKRWPLLKGAAMVHARTWQRRLDSPCVRGTHRAGGCAGRDLAPRPAGQRRDGRARRRRFDPSAPHRRQPLDPRHPGECTRSYFCSEITQICTHASLRHRSAATEALVGLLRTWPVALPGPWRIALGAASYARYETTLVGAAGFELATLSSQS